MEEFHRGSSSVTRIEIHVSYKVKYCHKVFDISEVKQRCREIFYEVAALQKVEIKEVGFGGNHVQMDIIQPQTLSMCQINKSFKGTSGRKLL